MPLISQACRNFSGEILVPGDKSISHRALILGALAIGETNVSGLLESQDIMSTVNALRELGVEVEPTSPKKWKILGVGTNGFKEPSQVLDLGNSGTAVRLLMGAVASHPFTTFFSGDHSLIERPMSRVVEPLTLMGARMISRNSWKLPLALTGSSNLLPINYVLPVPSAQVKSAILLAGLSAPGETSVVENIPSRNHTENMLRHFGVNVDIQDNPDGTRRTILRGYQELKGVDLSVPADISSAAFLISASLLVQQSNLLLRNIGINPLRSGFLTCISEMGGRIRFENKRKIGEESIADIHVETSDLRSIDIPASRAPSMIDEYPILAMLVACAKGKSRLRGLRELRFKESDRFMALLRGLNSCGVNISEEEDDLIIEGLGVAPVGGVKINSDYDHRIAMSFLVLGMVSKNGIVIDDGGMIDTSFPKFIDIINKLGGNISET